ncbi:hypothetical protein [Prochlorococcus marinus]|uniref:Uncharacterized protein n=1 Tax=Prochlorococcus marinus (strain MIT 9211) TaxID=93059 RepID=A9BBA1_PROM4|nr:hypothetical protein [Prochlorococcus marinus]ABX09113.1 Hypothetical protein P9211_11821 [Prochlorococcus marinus str. MIT 9211]
MFLRPSMNWVFLFRCYMVRRPLIVGALAIQPEVIPLNSQEGESAKQIHPKSIVFLAFAIFFALLIFFLKTIFSLALMAIGLGFIWQQAAKRLSAN